MPVFDWDTGTLVANEGFRIYWAIAIPLTLVVLLVWIVCMALPWGIWVKRFYNRRRSDTKKGGLRGIKV